MSRCVCASLIFTAIERDFVDGFTGEAKTRALRPRRGDNKHDKRLKFNLAVECVTAGFLATIAETTLV